MTLKSYYPELFPAGPIIPEKVEIIPFDLHEVMQSLGPSIGEVWLAEASPAADKAKKLGLHYLGYAKWADQSGQYVAKTVDGKLIKVSPQEAEKYAKKTSKKSTQDPYAGGPVLDPITHQWGPPKPDSKKSSKEPDPFSPDPFSAAGIAAAVNAVNKKEKEANDPDDAEIARRVLGKKIGGPKGSNPGGIWKGADGEKRYVKEYEDPNQAFTERLANNIYARLGVDVPGSTVFKHKGKLMFTSGIIAGKTLADVWEERDENFRRYIAEQIVTGFAADVLLSNWDAIGLEADNIIVSPEGKPYRIDNGGSLLYRTQGKKKNAKSLGTLGELKTFFDPKKNSTYTRILHDAGYKNIKNFSNELIRQIGTIARVRKNNDGWKSYINEAMPGWSGKEKELTAKILEVRTNKLIQLAKALRKAQGPLAAITNDPLGMTKTVIKGEKTIVLDENTNPDKYYTSERQLKTGGLSPNQRLAIDRFAAEDATSQAKKWRSKLDLPVIKELLEIQRGWQSEEHYEAQNSEINSFLNKVIGEGTPAIVNTKIPIERGMTIKSGHISEFLSNFKIGKKITLPPSGFSAKPHIARNFTGVVDHNAERVSVILRVHPKNGKAVGLHLAYTSAALSKFGSDSSSDEKEELLQNITNDIEKQYKSKKEEWLQTHPEPDPNQTELYADPQKVHDDWSEKVAQFDYNKNDQLQQIQQDYEDNSGEFEGMYGDEVINNWADDYDDEAEIIRPGNALNKVMGVTKYLLNNRDDEMHATFIIDMQEMGITKDPELIREFATSIKKLAVLYKYVNGPLKKFAQKIKKQVPTPKKPLNEASQTADKAKKLGLHYLGYGKWANSSGKYIAKTVNDKLIKVSPQESNQHHAKVSAWPSYKDKYAAHQSQPKEPPKEQPKQKPEPTDTTSILRKLRVNKGQEFLKKTLVKGEEVHVLSDTGLFGGTVDTGDNADDELNKYQQAHDYFSGDVAALQKNNKQEAHAYLDATQQAKLWRSKLPLKEATELLRIQGDWQDSNQWKTSPMSRKSRNRFLNSVIGSKHPPIVHTKIPLERGMSIKNKDIKSFLANFSIGKYATLPPSGYTAVPLVARAFLRAGEHDVGVLLRVHPHNGKAIGLHLAKTNVALKPIKKQLRQQYMKDRKAVHDKWVKYKNTWLKKHPKPSSKKFKNDEKWYDAYEDWKNALENITQKERYERYELEDHRNDSLMDWNDSYNREHEVIRPGNAMGKVMKISKYLLHSTFDKEFTPYYIIDMQEAGLTRNKKMIKEETQETPEQKQQKLLQRATLYKYVNGPINMFKKAKEKVLKKYTNSPVRQEK